MGDPILAVDYGVSGVLFDLNSGKVVQRFTVADGWPKRRPPEFPRDPGNPFRSLRMVGSGVLNPYYELRSFDPSVGVPVAQPGKPVVLTQVSFHGTAWRAIQPAAFLDKIQGRSRDTIAWSDVLMQLHEVCYINSVPDSGGQTRRFTTADGLASNIVTHMVVHNDTLWAACVDIFDQKASRWGLGGLCRYDEKSRRWERVEKIDGHPVRWVTLLMTVDDDLWVGFREGEGVEGDSVIFGKGLYPGTYRPKATSLVLARLAGGRWTTLTRPPRPEEKRTRTSHASAPKYIKPPTEYPVSVARAGNQAVLFSQADGNGAMGNWDVEMTGHVSLVDLTTHAWRLFDPGRRFRCRRDQAYGR